MKIRILSTALCVATAFIFIFAPYIGAAKENVYKPKIYLISIPGLSFQEITPSLSESYPQLNKMIKSSGIGSLNIRTPFKGIEDSYLTMGAGAPATTLDSFHTMHQNELRMGETAASLFVKYTGQPAGNSDLVVPEIHAIQKMNTVTDYGANPGLFGETLEKAGVSTAFYGNRDRDEMRRSAALMIMNKSGRIHHGLMDERVLISDKSRPFGVKTNYSSILSHFKPYQVVLIELGDLDRLYAEKQSYAEHIFEQKKLEILQEIDTFMGDVTAGMNSSDSLWVFSPEVHPDAFRDKSMLAPVIWYKKQGMSPSLLKSNTTRRSGVIANIDIAPSVLKELGIVIPAEFIGSPVYSLAKENHFASLNHELMTIEHVYRLRPQLLYSFVIYEMMVLLIGLFFAIRKSGWNMKWLSMMLFSTLIAPIIMLGIHWFSEVSNLLVIFVFYFTIFSLGWVLSRFSVLKSMGILSGVIMFVILLDGALGAELMKRSILGYDPMIGARYYGIGNEYMGILIGAVILGISVGMHYWSKSYPRFMFAAVSIIFIYIIVYLGSPSLGTNAGGAITACIAFGVFWVRMFGGDKLKEIRWFRLMTYMALFGATAILGLWVLNHLLAIHTDQQSHIGRAMGHMFSGRFDVVGNLIMRKLSMNWHLIGVSSWSKVFITSLFVMAVIVSKPRGVFRKWQNTMPHIMYGFSANAIGAIIVLMVNDSGIVAAATMIIYVAVPALLLKIHDNSVSHSS